MWEAYKKGFKAYLQLEKSLSENSVEAYVHDIEKLIQFLEVKKIEKNPKEIDLPLLEIFFEMDQWTGNDKNFTGKDHFRIKKFL